MLNGEALELPPAGPRRSRRICARWVIGSNERISTSRDDRRWHAGGMVATPATVYARDGDVHLAYQVLDNSGPDVLFVPTATFPIDLLWDEPTVAGHLRRLGSFGRLIATDLLGMGSSDAVPISDRPAMQAWTDGLVAVLDAAGSECVSVFAMAESALPAMFERQSPRPRALTRAVGAVRPLRAWPRPVVRNARADPREIPRRLPGHRRDRPSSKCSRRAGPTTPPNGGGGPAASASPADPATSRRSWISSCVPTFGPS